VYAVQVGVGGRYLEDAVLLREVAHEIMAAQVKLQQKAIDEIVSG
jgi:hypothetical protein